MEKERLRIPSDSSSGSSCRGGASPNSTFRNGKPPVYIQTGNVGPTTNFSLLSQSPSHTLPPPPGLTHPIFHYPPCTAQAPGFQTVNYGMSGSLGQTHLPAHHQFSPANAGKYNVSRFAVQNGSMQTPPVSPPPGYNNYFGNLHSSQQPMPPPCSVSSNRPYPSQYMSYNETGEPANIEKQINSILEASDASKFYGNGIYNGDKISSALSYERMTNGKSTFIGSSPVPDDEKLGANSRVGGVMNPIIENIVGSINNGAYTHFGPSISSNDKMQNGQVSADLFRDSTIVGKANGSSSEIDRKTLFSRIAVNSANKEISVVGEENMMNIGINSNGPGIKPTPINPVTSSTTSSVTDVCKENDMTVSDSFAKSPSPAEQQRTSSPKEIAETSSRPQTPGKPSYLEVLTKASLKGQQNTSASSTRKTSSTSSSPVQSVFSAACESVPNLCHRKSVDYLIGSTSTPSSSCPSASSSPASKPRNFMAGIQLKGKENVSAAKSGSNSKNSPSNSPSHSNIQPQLSKGKSQLGDARKILSTQNNSSSMMADLSSSSKAKDGKALKNGKIHYDKPVEVEGMSEGVSGDWGWKTYTIRGRNNNLSSVGNKNSKRASNGSCYSEAVANNAMYLDDEDDDERKRQNFKDDTVFEKKPSSSTFGSSSTSVTHSRKPKEKPRNKKEDRHCLWRRMESYVYIWLAHMISALAWLWSLVTDVATLSASLGMSLIQDFYAWTKTKALPNCMDRVSRWRTEVVKLCGDCWSRCKGRILSFFSRGSSTGKRPEESSHIPGPRGGDENILSLLGPERNITLPANGDEALKRLLSVKGQDPYSILGVRSDSSDETIRRYYKRQAVLVHPDKNLIVGAEEAFKILARAFELVGDPIKRSEYHQKLMEAQAKEKFCGEIGNLLEQLRKKMEAASSTIRCTKCNSRHKKNVTDRPLFAARYCSQCRIHHGAREGELWAERAGWFGISWNYFACMDAHVWEINEWARCQKTNLKHIKADAHCVMYRLVAGGNNHQNQHNQHCHGNGASCEEGVGSEADEWDSLINNLCKSPAGSTSFGKTTGVPGKPGCCSNGNASSTNTTSANSQATGRRRKGKRSK